MGKVNDDPKRNNHDDPTVYVPRTNGISKPELGFEEFFDAPDEDEDPPDSVDLDDFFWEES